MSERAQAANSTAHRELSASIPWYVNDTLDDGERKRLDAHLEHCAACRIDLELERQVHAVMNTDSGVEYLPAPSLKRLQSRLDALEDPGSERRDLHAFDAETADAHASAAAPRRWSWKSALAASLAALAIGIGLLVGERHVSQTPGPFVYHTVTDATARPAGEVIRAVFVPSITLVELQTILDESELRIIAGPSEAGVYSLAANTTRPVNVSLDLLRSHSAVRFAESSR